MQLMWNYVYVDSNRFMIFNHSSQIIAILTQTDCIHLQVDIRLRAEQDCKVTACNHDNFGYVTISSINKYH